MQKVRMIDKAKFIRRIVLLLLITVLVILIQRIVSRNKNQEATSSIQTNMLAQNENSQNRINNNTNENKPIDKIIVVIKNEEENTGKNEEQNIEKNEENEKKEVELDWNLLLVNTYNKMPDDYNVQLESIDQYRSFDVRAIQYLTKMMNDIRYAGISNIWIQSAYRKPEDQRTLFENQVQAYIYQGYSEKVARELTEKHINKPWHWRYVGKEHAKKMKSQNLCLEEYIEQITSY